MNAAPQNSDVPCLGREQKRQCGNRAAEQPQKRPAGRDNVGKRFADACAPVPKRKGKRRWQASKSLWW